MSQPESSLSRKIQRALRLEGWFCFKVHGNEFTMDGLPDIIVCAEGQFIGLETKMPGKRGNTSAKQDLRRDEIHRAGGFYQVVCSEAEAVAVVRRALARS
jgi:hypothetical protein